MNTLILAASVRMKQCELNTWPRLGKGQWIRLSFPVNTRTPSSTLFLYIVLQNTLFSRSSPPYACPTPLLALNPKQMVPARHRRRGHGKRRARHRTDGQDR